ncbi:MAG: GNAT family N-acetyltransferase, partial [Chloroflexota bacterium]|nr:GNAT family N-acetyltransferase [Chloroflexota bacterium]
IVGFVGGGKIRIDNPENDLRYESELYAIYLLNEAQGHGIGRRLMLTLVEKLVEASMNSMLLWVFAKNPARHFYESMGGQKIKESQFELNGAQVDEVAYGWNNIKTLLEK